MQRPGFKKDEFNEQIRFLKDNYNASILTVEMPLIDISSTDIRERLQKSQSIKYMLPDNVLSYINKEGLYARVGLKWKQNKG
jgi:nicotinate-nucleotide adenylyltransferase